MQGPAARAQTTGAFRRALGRAICAVALLGQFLFPVGTVTLPLQPTASAADAAAPALEQVSVADRGGPGGNADSLAPSISADGRWVAFASTATNLDPTSPDTNGVSDVFVFDRLNGVTRRISPAAVSNCTTSCLRGSFDPVISADGSRVAYVSDQRLVGEDGNDVPDVYVTTLPSGPTLLVSSDFQSAVRFAVGGHAPAISGNGRFVAFVSANPFISTSDTTRCTTPGTSCHVLAGDPLGTPNDDVFEQDLNDFTVAPTLISATSASTPTTANGASGEPSVSADGSVVAFTSVADNLVTPGSLLGADPTVFLRSVPSASTAVVSTQVDGRGGGHPSISADGNRVAYTVGEPIATTPGGSSIVVPSTGSTPVTITNTGGGVLFVGGFTILGSPDFTNLGPQPGTTFCDDAGLLNGESCSVNVMFTPGTSPETATFTFQYFDTPAPVATTTSVTLVGSAPSAETATSAATSTTRTTTSTSSSTTTTKPAATTVPTTAPATTVPTAAAAAAATVPTTIPATVPSSTSTSTTRPTTPTSIPLVTVPALRSASAGQPLNVNSSPSSPSTSTSTSTTIATRQSGTAAPALTSPALAAPAAQPSSPASSAALPSGTAFSLPTGLGPLDMNGVADVYVADVGASTVTPVSTRDAPCPSPCVSLDAVDPALSADGGAIAFSSASPELVPNDTNGSSDVFWRDLLAPSSPIVRVSETVAGGETTAGSSSLRPSISGDGHDVAFDSDAENLLSGGAAGVAAGPPSPNPGPVPTNLLSGPVLPVFSSTSPVSTTAAARPAGTAQPATNGQPTTATTWPLLSSGGVGAATAAPTSTTTSTWPLLSSGRASTPTTWPLLSSGAAGPPAPAPAPAPAKATSGTAQAAPAPLLPAAPTWPLLTAATVAPQATASEVIRDVFVKELLPLPVFSPTTQDFGSSEVDVASAPQTFTLTNTGPGTMQVTQAVIQGANPADFSVTNSTCDGVTLHILESCTVTVTFVPTAPGVRQGSLAVVTDAPNGSPSVALQGTGTSPPFTVGPNPVAFGSVGVGLSSTVDVTITNGGVGTHAVGPLSLTGPNASEFQITNPTACSAPLPPGGSCTVTLAFNPTAAGPSSATLNGTFAGAPFAVPITGTGVAGTLTIAPNPVDFGSVAGGDPPVDQVVTVTNQGPGVVSITGVTVTSGASDFTVGTDACTGATLIPTQSCTVHVGFTPAALGTRPGQLSIQSTAASVATVPLTGTGTTPPFTIAPNPVDFGSVGVGVPTTMVVTITNAGATPHTVGPLSLAGPNASDFQITGSTCSGALPAGSSCTVMLGYTPTTAGVSNATLTATFGASAVQFAVPITGTGVAGTLAIAPSPVDFGSAAVGDPPVDKVVTITNNGPGVVLVTGVTASGGPDFTLGADACTGATLSPTQSCTVHVAFAPAAAGARTGQLTVQSTAASVATAPLTGTGTNPPFTVDPTSLDYGSVGLGLPSSKIVTITNNSAGTHPVGPLSLTGPNASDFTITNTTCNVPLPPGGSCTATVTYTPTTAGVSNATLTGAFGGVPFAVPLTGTGVAGTLTIAPNPVDFGSVDVGDPPVDKVVTITNNGPGVVLVTGVTASGGPDFTLGADGCTGVTLFPTQSCTVHVGFTPFALGARTGQVSIQSTAASVATAPLTGTGTPPPFTVQPNPVDFGSVGVGLTSTMTVTIMNTDTVPHTLGTPTVIGPNASEFAITSSTCGTTPIPPGGSCTLTLALTPTTAGSSNATLAFGSSAFGVPLLGTGVAGTLKIDPNPVDFGSAAVGGPAVDKVVTVTNTGPGIVLVTGVMVSSGAPDFTVTQDTCTGQTLQPTQSCTVHVVFAPSAVGSRQGQLSVLSTAASVATAKLTGTGTSAAISVSPPSVDFGASPVGQPAPDQTVTIKSTAVVANPISSLNITGPNAPDFKVATQSCTSATGSGTTCTIGLRFTPSANGAESATLAGTFGPTQTPFSVPLQGFGGVPPTTTTTTTTTPGATTTTPGATTTTPGVTTSTPGSTPGSASTTTTTVAAGEPGSGGAGGASTAPGDAGTAPAGASPATGGTTPTTPASAPVIVLSLTLGPPGTVTTVNGSGFLPNTTLQLRWVLNPNDPQGIVIDLGTVVTGADGTFANAPALVFANDPIGPRTLSADGGTDQVATANFLVVPGTAQPSANLAVTLHQTQLVVRG